MVIGTPAFCPMEYSNQGHVSIKVDAYALGVTIAVTLTNLNPFNTNVVELLEEAMENGSAAFAACLDPTAGEWDPDKAMAVARVAMRLGDHKYRSRATCAEVLAELEVAAGMEPRPRLQGTVEC